MGHLQRCSTPLAYGDLISVPDHQIIKVGPTANIWPHLPNIGQGIQILTSSAYTPFVGTCRFANSLNHLRERSLSDWQLDSTLTSTSMRPSSCATSWNLIKHDQCDVLCWGTNVCGVLDFSRGQYRLKLRYTGFSLNTLSVLDVFFCSSLLSWESGNLDRTFLQASQSYPTTS